MIKLNAWSKGRSSMFGSYDVVSQEDTVANDRVVKKPVIKTVLPSERFQDMKASDFYLENVIAAGALDMLRPVQLHDGGLDSVDVLDLNVSNLMDAIDNSEAPKITDEE